VDRLAAQLSWDAGVRFAGAGHIGDESVELAVMVQAPGERLHIKRRFDLGDDESVDASAAKIVGYFNRHSFLLDPEATQRTF